MTAVCTRSPAAALVLALLAACGSDRAPGITAPGAPGEPSFASSPWSDWSEPRPLGPPINSAFADYQAALSRDGLTLYFTSSRLESPDDVNPDQNIWASRRACAAWDDAACAWGEPVRLPSPVNLPGLDVSPSLSRDEHWLFFSSNRPGSGERDLYAAWRSDVHDPLDWESAVPLGPGINTPGAEVAPSFFANEEEGVPLLYFNRGAPGGDIYVSRMMSDGSWGVATEVTELNSAGSDQRATVRFDGREVYFWSDRSGLARLWHSSRAHTSDPWSPPQMVPSPIADGDGLHPFIHSRGTTETLLFTRTIAGSGFDLFVSTRTRGGP